MEVQITGREKEQNILQKALDSPEPELVAIIGRIRVGKTFLIRTFFKDRIVFEMTGVQNISLKEQLENFSEQLKEANGSALPVQKPADWFEAFRLLKTFLKPYLGKKNRSYFWMNCRGWQAKKQVSFPPWVIFGTVGLPGKTWCLSYVVRPLHG